jgi:hypothetical protein
MAGAGLLTARAVFTADVLDGARSGTATVGTVVAMTVVNAPAPTRSPPKTHGKRSDSESIGIAAFFYGTICLTTRIFSKPAVLSKIRGAKFNGIGKTRMEGALAGRTASLPSALRAPVCQAATIVDNQRGGCATFLRAARCGAAIGEVSILAFAMAGIAAGQRKARSIRRQIAISLARLGDEAPGGGRHNRDGVPTMAGFARHALLRAMIGIQFCIY